MEKLNQQLNNERVKMAATIDEITVNYEEDGLLKVQELAKEILTRGAWTTILFKFQDWNAKDNCYGPVKYTIRRYQKKNDMYRQQSKFNISNNKQADQICTVLQNWIKESAEDGADNDTPDAGDDN
jgi:hypothetical protein